MDFSRIISSFQSISRDLNYVNNSRDSKLNKLALSVILLIGTLTTAYTFKKLKNSRVKKLTIPLGLSITAIVARKLLHKQAARSQSEIQAAIRLQSTVRMSVDKRKYLATRAAVRLQSIARMWVDKRKYLANRAAAIRLQSAARRLKVTQQYKFDQHKSFLSRTRTLKGPPSLLCGIPLELIEKKGPLWNQIGDKIGDNAYKIAGEEILEVLEKKFKFLEKTPKIDELSPILDSLRRVDSRETYAEFINLLRNLLQTHGFQANFAAKSYREPNDDVKLEAIFKICRAIFYPQVHSLLAERRQILLLGDISAETSSSEDLQGFSNCVRQERDRIEKALKATDWKTYFSDQATVAKTKAAGSYDLKDFLVSNSPYIRETQYLKEKKRGTVKELLYLRMPTPHMPGAKVAPEFNFFLHALESKQEGLLYICHQDKDSRTESARCNSLSKLATEQKNFHLIFQSFDGDLFKKNREFLSTQTFSDLKEELISSFINGKHGNDLPASLKNDSEYEQRMKNLFDIIHQSLFSGREEITQKEWQSCIMAFYILMSDDLKVYLNNITHFTTPCKDFFDRGGARAACEDALHLIMSGVTITSSHLNEIKANLLPVPVIDKKQPPLSERLEPAYRFFDLLAGLTPEQKKPLEDIEFVSQSGSTFKFKGREIQKQPNQSLFKGEQTSILKQIPSDKEFTVTDDTLAQNNLKTFQTPGCIKKQMTKDLPRQTVIVKTREEEQTAFSDAQTLILQLKNQFNLSDDIAFLIAAQIPQNALKDVTEGLKKLLNTDESHLTDSGERQQTTITQKNDEQAITIEHKKTFHLKDLVNGEVVATIPTTTTIVCFFKDDNQVKEWSGKWSWSYNTISRTQSSRAGSTSGGAGSSSGTSSLAGSGFLVDPVGS